MGDKNVNKFCELVIKINERNEYLKKDIRNFYDGGYSFDEYQTLINELIDMQNELKNLIKIINE
jgi:hypothetical protein